MTGTAGRIAYKSLIQDSPIILRNGVASVFGGFLPLAMVTESIRLANSGIGMAVGGNNSGMSLTDFAINWTPGPATHVDNDIATYPYASQAIAADSVVRNPSSLVMFATFPNKDPAGLVTKLAIVSAMRRLLRYHSFIGGTFDICTPTYIFTGMLLKSFTEVTSDPNRNVGLNYQLDFMEPLIQASALSYFKNNALTAFGGGAKTIPTQTPFNIAFPAG